jgi:2-polyprenyl-3-methyl-5-hydroxy-6-metoxy-1,4-benzoquinol methylase
MPTITQLERAYALKGVSEARDFYDEWAATYNDEMAKEGREYMAPTLASKHLADILGPSDIASCAILDSGCGTGLVGARLKEMGAKNIDGIDISTGMMEVARETEAYNSLSVADLSKRLAIEDNTYKAVICVGTLTRGHVGPEILDEFARVTQVGGFIVATVLGTVWEQGGYCDKVKDLVAGGTAALISADLEDIVPGTGTQAVMLILRAM